MLRSASPRILPSGELVVRPGAADGGRPFQMWKRLRMAWWCRTAWRRLMVVTLALRPRCLVVVEVTVAEVMVVVVVVEVTVAEVMMVVVVCLMRGRVARRRMLSERRRECGPTMAFRYHTPLSLWMVWRRLITSRYGTATCAIPRRDATCRIASRAAGFRSTPSYCTTATLRWRRGTSLPLSALSNGSSLATSYSCASTVASGLVDAGRTL